MNMKENEIFERVINEMSCKQACPFNTLSGCKKDELNNGICIMNEMTILGWVSVKDRLPPCETDVMVAFTHGVTIGMYEDGTIHTEDSDYCWNECDDLEYCEDTDDYIIPKGWWEASRFNPNDENGQIDREVTHWMPLPEPPKGVE